MSTLLDVTLVRTPEICGGSLRIDGTGMTVSSIVTLHKQGLTAQEIVENYPQRRLSEIYAVLAWYHEHKAEFDDELAAEDAEYDRLKAESRQAKRQLRCAFFTPKALRHPAQGCEATLGRILTTDSPTQENCKVVGTLRVP